MKQIWRYFGCFVLIPTGLIEKTESCGTLYSYSMELAQWPCKFLRALSHRKMLKNPANYFIVSQGGILEVSMQVPLRTAASMLWSCASLWRPHLCSCGSLGDLTVLLWRPYSVHNAHLSQCRATTHRYLEDPTESIQGLFSRTKHTRFKGNKSTYDWKSI